MGNQQSAPPRCAPGCSPTSAVSQAISQVQARQPTVTQDPVSACQATKIQANTLSNQLATENSKIDQCDPSVPLARRKEQIQQENQRFTKENADLMNELQKDTRDKFKMGNELVNAVKLLKQYEKDLKIKLTNAEKGSLKLEHDERKYRRDFLDNQPTDGVPWHIFGLQTSDDKVMLTFWITALISFSLLAHTLLVNLQPNADIKTRAVSGGVGVIVSLVISYLIITYYG